MAINFDKLRRTGVYTYYDKLVLTEAGAVVNMQDVEGVNTIYQWRLTGQNPIQNYPMIEGRAFDNANSRWNTWQPVGNPPNPGPAPEPVNPGTDPGDGMWDECYFRKTTLKGGNIETLGFSRGLGTVMSKPCFPVYDTQDIWTNANPDPRTVRSCYLTWNPATTSYMWKVRTTEDVTVNNVTLDNFRQYLANDFKLQYITVSTPTPANVVKGVWVKANQDFSFSATQGITVNVLANRIIFLYNTNDDVTFMRTHWGVTPATMQQIRGKVTVLDNTIPYDPL